jgi:hypothetical protein
VQVLDHDHGRRLPPVQLVEEGGEQLSSVSIVGAQLDQPAADAEGDLVQRTKRSGGEAAVTGPPPPAQLRTHVAERLDQRGLAGSRLTREQDQPAGAQFGVGCVLVEGPQEMPSLEQLHRRSLERRHPGQ